MKKLSPFIIAIVFALSACSIPAPAVPINTATPTFTKTLAFTATPAPTETLTPIPAPIEPYAIISSTKAEFWFPLLDKKEYEWGFPESFGPDYIWAVEIGDPQDYISIIVGCGYPKLESPQTGFFEDMLKTCQNRIITSSAPQDYVLANDVFTTSYSRGGLLIQMIDSGLINKLSKDKPQSMLFDFFQNIRITPSITPPTFTVPYAVILPDKANFWFPLPKKTEWIWNKPTDYLHLNSNTKRTFAQWDVIFGTYGVSTDCWTDWANFNKPVQKGSFEDLLKTCERTLFEMDNVSGDINDLERNPPTASYTNGGLLIELTDPEFMEFLYNNKSQSIYFFTNEPFDVIPIYE